MARTLLTLFILIIVLSFFGISIRGILTSPTGKDNLTFIWELVRTGVSIIESYFYSIVHNLQEIGTILGSSSK